MRDDNGTPVAIGVQQVIGPGQDRLCQGGDGAQVVLQVDDNKVHSAGAKELIAVGVVAVIRSSIVRAAYETADREICVKIRRVWGNAVMVLITIPRCNSIRDSGRFKFAHSS